MNNFYDFKMNKIDGKEVALNEYAGKVLLVVNVASKCGLTPQYEGLQKLYQQYHTQGFEVLGFPANEFLAQEPGSDTEIREFCSMNYGVEFPLFSKIVVKGEKQHPLYSFMTSMRPETTMKPNGMLMERLQFKGLLDGKDNDIKWNFEKFLIDKSGNIVERFSPEFDPQDPIITTAIERELQK